MLFSDDIVLMDETRACVNVKYKKQVRILRNFLSSLGWLPRGMEMLTKMWLTELCLSGSNGEQQLWYTVPVKLSVDQRYYLIPMLGI